MAVKTLYLKNVAAAGSNHGSLQDGGTVPTTATSTSGWIVSTLAPTRYARMDFGTERASSALLTTPVEPSSGPDNTLGDCWRTENTLTGAFAAANWTFSIPVMGITQATSTTDGRLRLRLWRSTDATGATAVTEITTATIVTSLFANLSNSAAQTLTVTIAVPAATLAAQYLFLQVAFELTGAAASNTADVHIRVGTGSQVTTSDFAVTVALAGLSANTSTNTTATLATAKPLVGVSTTTSLAAGTLAATAPRLWDDATVDWDDWGVTWDGTPREPDRSVNITHGTGTLKLAVPLGTGYGFTDTFHDEFAADPNVTVSGGAGSLLSPPIPLAGAAVTTSGGFGFLAVNLEGDSTTVTVSDGTLAVPVDPGAPDAILAASNLTGPVGFVQDSPDNPGPEWLTADDDAASTVLRVSFPTPAAAPASGGPRRMRVLVRRTVDPGAPDPQVTLELWEGGVLRDTLTTVAVTSTDGQIVEVTIDPADLTDPTGAGVELRVVGVPV